MTQQFLESQTSQHDVFRNTTIKDLETTWNEIQTKTFLSWVNHHLASKGVTVTDLREAFKDGVNLILLLEALTNRRVGRYNPNPRFTSHKLDNLLVAISFIERTWNVKVLGVNPNELLEGNLKQTMGILFLLIHKCKPTNQRQVTEPSARGPSLPRLRTDTASFITTSAKGQSAARTTIAASSSASQLHSENQSASTTVSSPVANVSVRTSPDNKQPLSADNAHSLREERKLIKRTAYASLNTGPTLREHGLLHESPESIMAKFDSAETQNKIVMVQAYIRRYRAMRLFQTLREHLQTVKTTLCSSPTLFRGLQRLQALIRGRLVRKHLRARYKRNDIAREIISTEEVYVRRLGVLKNVFREELQKLGPDLCPPNVLRTIFSESEVIRLYNEVILQQLKERMQRWYSSGQKLGDIFLKMTEYLKVYTAYVNNYNDAFNTLTTLMKNPRVQECLNNCRARPECEGLEISSFLILPVQRIPRYVLLLQDLFKHTPEGHPDYEDLKKALEKMQTVADYVNEKKREAENLNAVLAIWHRISGMPPSYNLAQPHRKYVRQGRLVEVKGLHGDALTKGSERYCFLFNDLLLVTKEKSGYFKKHKDTKALTMTDLKDPKSEPTFKFLYVMHIAEAQLSDLPDSDSSKFTNMFQVAKSLPSVVPPPSSLVMTTVGEQVATPTLTPTTPAKSQHDSKEIAGAGVSGIGSQLSSVISEDAEDAVHLEERHDQIFSALDAQDKSDWMTDIDECIASLLDTQRSRLGLAVTQREHSPDAVLEEERLPDSLNYVMWEGELWKRGETEWKLRYFVLKGTNLLYFQSREHYNSSTVAPPPPAERLSTPSAAANNSAATVPPAVDEERQHKDTTPTTPTTPASTPIATTHPSPSATDVAARETSTSVPSTTENTPRPVNDPSGVIPLLRTTIKSVPVSDRPFTLQVLTKERIYYLAAASNAEKFNWINKMRHAIYLHLTHIKKERERAEKEKQDFEPAVIEFRRAPENNNQCAECEAKDPLWVSLTFGVFLCDECAQIHKNMGAWNQLKSIHKTSKWSPEEINALKAMGNAKAKEKYVKNMSSAGLSQPTEKDSVETKTQWIMKKYEDVIKEEHEKLNKNATLANPTESAANTAKVSSTETTASTESDRKRGESTTTKEAKEAKNNKAKDRKGERKRLHSKSKSEKMKSKTSPKDLSKFHKDGSLLRKKDNHWYKYHFVLKDGVLSYYKAKKTKAAGVISLVLCQPVKDIVEKEMKVKETHTPIYAFDLQTSDRVFTLGSPTKDEVEEWRRLINDSIRCLQEVKAKK
jgi:hypothetical protein